MGLLSAVLLLSCQEEMPTVIQPDSGTGHSEGSGGSTLYLSPLQPVASESAASSVVEEFAGGSAWGYYDGVHNYFAYIDIDKAGLIEDVDVVLNVNGFLGGSNVLVYRGNHPELSVLSPLSAARGFNFVDTRFDDEATALLPTGSAPYTGSFKPFLPPLSAFDGTDMRGRWILWIQSYSSQSLSNWKLVITYTPTDEPPMANAGIDRVVECTGDPTVVQLNGSASSDAEGPIASYEWSEGGSVIAGGATPSVDLSHGTHTILLTVTDGEGQTDTDEVTITVEDTTPPSIALAAGPTTLWPPNNKMIQVVSGASASDACGVSSLSVTVTSSDNDPADWSVVEGPGGSYDVFVRAEKAADGGDRSYTISVTATDDSGLTATSTVTVVVPHSQGK